jgi:NDP-sugar pyrophosphorylase family protein
MKERVTLTIEASVLKQVDGRVDGNKIRNRSHAVEMLIREALKGDIPETAVILAGGKEDQVKRALTHIDGKSVLQHNIELLLGSGIDHILIISKETERIKAALPEFDAEIRYITETNPMGTAGSLHLAAPYIQNTFVVLNADDKKELNITEMYHFHNSHNGLCSIALTTTSDPSNYGVALLNGNRIITFIEKPPQPAPSNLISAGCYFMDKEVLDLIPEGYAHLETDLFPKLTKEDSLYGYPFSGEYQHI